MVDRSVRVVLSATASGFNTTMAAAASKTKGLSDALTKNEQQINTLTSGMGKVGLVAAAGVGLAVKTFADFDAKMSGVASTGADARKNIDALRNAAIEMGAKTSFSAGEAAEGIEELAKAGVTAEDTLGGGLKGALDLAAAGQLGVGEAAEIAATAMTQFKLEGTDVPHIADLLAAGAGKAQGEVTDMGEALKQSGLVASSFGLSIEETTGGLAAFAGAGLIGSDAGTSFKTMLQSLANPSRKTKELMDELGVSAYDAEGNFVGLSGLAGTLQESMKGLSQESRNAAMAQIFGSDAVRAANVLYEEGADGIAGWIDAVDDSGYAAETAETKLDNLKGDVEGLKGAFETALIGLGEGADGPLRKFVESLTDGVNKFNELGDGTKSTILAVGAGVAALALTGAAIGKTAIGINNTVTAFRDLRTASPGVVTGLGKVAKAAGIAATAVAALHIGADIAKQYSDEVTPEMADFEAALLKLSDAAPGAKQSLDDLFNIDSEGFWTADLNQEKLEGFTAAAERLVDKSFGDKMNDTWAKVSSTLTGVEGIAEKAAGRMEELDNGLAAMVQGGNTDEAAKSFANLSKQWEDGGHNVNDLLPLFSQYRSSLVAQANELKVTNLSNEDYVAWMGGKVPKAIQEAQKKTDAQKKATHGLTDATDEASAAAEAQAEALKKQTDEAFIATQQILKMRGGQIAVEAAIDDATASVKKNGQNLDITTKKGRDNRQALDQIAAAALDLADTQREDGVTSEKEIQRQLGRSREQYIKTAEKMGMSRGEAKKLADQLFDIPSKVKTEVSTPGMSAAQRETREFKKLTEGLSDKEIDIVASFGVSASKAVVKMDAKFGGGGLRDIIGRATGGPINNWSGDGVKGKDTELIMAAYGEHMWTDKEVDAVGGHEAMYRMRRAALRGELRGFRDGGAITRSLDANLITNPLPDISGALDGPTRALADSASDALNHVALSVKEAINEAAINTFGLSAAGWSGKIDMNNPRGLTTFRGHRFTNLAAATLKKTEQQAGATFIIYQGGFRPTTSYSGTSHAGDAIDAQVNGALMRAGIKNGLKLWDRTGMGNWMPHMHGVFAPGAGYGGGSAVWQWQDYLRGGNGLAEGGLVGGYSPHSKADNLMYWLTAKEFVQPVAAVEKYGIEFMEAIRTLKFPTGHLAEGGPVTAQPVSATRYRPASSGALSPDDVQAMFANTGTRGAPTFNITEASDARSTAYTINRHMAMSGV